MFQLLVLSIMLLLLVLPPRQLNVQVSHACVARLPRRCWLTTDSTGDEDRGHRRRRGSQGLKVAQGEVREFGLFACLADVQVRERSRVDGADCKQRAQAQREDGENES